MMEFEASLPSGVPERPPLDPVLETVIAGTIRRHSAPLQPRPTGVEPVLPMLPGIRAVLFDVYGTLLISGSGDVGTAEVGDDPRPDAFRAALEAVGVPFAGSQEDADAGVRWLAETIEGHHQRLRAGGIEYPEVDIREVWAEVVDRLAAEGLFAEEGHLEETTLLALEYELRTNPVWPMPSAPDTLRRLREGGMMLGIVSNAQIFTRVLFRALMDQSLEELGFRRELCLWSHEHRQAKPGTFLFERAREALQARGIAAADVLYVGNDMLKDVLPAAQAGFRTALFAGDARSYRPRSDDPGVRNVTPEGVLTELAQLPGCIGC